MRQKRSVVQDVSYCQSGSNVIMVIWKFIKSQLSYFIVGQGKECTYVYFHILYWFQLCFKTLCKRFKHNIKIPFGANFVWISKSSQTNYENKIIFQMARGSCKMNLRADRAWLLKCNFITGPLPPITPLRFAVNKCFPTSLTHAQTLPFAVIQNMQ